jgi:hypothetical protein
MCRSFLFSLAILGIVTAATAFPWSSALAHGWDFAVDTPVLFTFDKSGPNKPAPGSSAATWRDTTSTDVSGSKVMLTTPLHIGIGYEDYSVSQHFNVGGSCNGNCGGHATESIQMVDVMVHLPIAGLNVGLGYGQGQASLDAIGPPGGPNPNISHHANAQQAFLVLGVPMGKHWDAHLGYHWISVEQKAITGPGQNPPYDQFQGNGEMLSFGLQYSWGR